MDREVFLDRVRRAADSGRRYEVDVPAVPKEAGYVGSQADLCQALFDEIAFVGGEPQIASSWEEARAIVVQHLENYGVKSAYCWQHPVLERLGLHSLLSERNIRWHDHSSLLPLIPEERKLAALAADIGISSTDVAIAETGTLAVFAKTGQERLSTLITPVHIAIVSREQIVPDLFDLFHKLAASGLDKLPSAVTLISGPSKTGDIELELTTGVHGPGKWHVIIVDAD